MRLPVPKDAGSVARRLIKDGLDPNELLEFCRGDMVCLRGKAGTFAAHMVKEGRSGRPRHVPYVPFARSRLAPVRKKRRPARLLVLD